MAINNTGIISHVSLGTRDIERAVAFYDVVLATVGASRKEVVELEDQGLVAVAYGKQLPEFWIQIPDNENPAAVGNGVHVGFTAPDIQSVHTFHKTALVHGGKNNGLPGPRPQYGEPYYGCFVLDPDGNKIEASFWDETLV